MTLQEAEGGKAGKSNAAIVKREEEYLQSQAAEVGAQIRALEAQLSSLRSQQAELDSRLLEIHSQGRGGGAWESAGKGKQTVRLCCALLLMYGYHCLASQACLHGWGLT